MKARIPKNKDRHRAGSVQMKVWVPVDMRNDFTSLCAVQGVCASDVLRGLLTAYIRQSSGKQHG